MRKLFTTFVLALVSICGAYAGSNEISLKTGLSAHDYPLDNGFILRGGIGITSSKYLLSDEEADFDGGDSYMPAATFGIELGNQWYVWRASDESMGIAINANWFDFQFGVGAEDDDFGGSYASMIFDMSFLEVGPMYTYAVNDDIGIDLFFNFRPTLLVGAYTYDDGSNDDTAGEAGFGLTYAVGTSFRWRALLVGVEYDFGKVKMSSDDFDYADDYKVNANVFKINIGVKL